MTTFGFRPSFFKRSITLGSLLLLAISFAACRTSQDIAKGRVGDDPTGVRTLPADAPQLSVDELQRNYDVARGQLEDQNYAHEQARTQWEQRFKVLENDRELLINEVLRAGGQLPNLASLSLRAESEPRTREQIESDLVSGVSALSRQSPETVTGAGTLPPALAGAAAATATTAPESSSNDPATRLWQLARSDIQSESFDGALRGLEEFLRLYPNDQRRPFALLGLAMLRYRGTRYREAALHFNQVIDFSPEGAYTRLAWFGQGAVFARLGQKEDSTLFFNEVRSRFPNSTEAKKAQAIIRNEDTVPGDLFKAFPDWSGPSS